MPAGALTSNLPRLEGTRRILRFNWPLYAGGAVVCAAGAIAATLPGLPVLARSVEGLTATAAGYLLLSSVVVSWWVYDHSDLRDWRWLVASLPAAATTPDRVASPPGTIGRPAGRLWALCHAGLDEAGVALAGLLGPPLAVLDIGDGLPRWSPSLRRARAAFQPELAPRPASPDALPLEDGAVDLVVLVFAAHEVRGRGQRAELFREVARVVRRGGAVVLVEHPRDLANMIAFGPGAWHFFPRGDWLALARDAGLELAAEPRQTPFVRGFVLCRR